MDYLQKQNQKDAENSVNSHVHGGKKSLLLEDNRPSSVVQKKGTAKSTIQKKVNNTGLPENLKSGIENLSGLSMNDVKVHYNSDKPAQLNAHAYAQGTDIHIATGQDKHIAHEAWHVVQQKQGRVKPTVQMKDKVNVNDDKKLEKEADVMGELAQRKGNADNAPVTFRAITLPQSSFMPVQGVWNLTGLAANVTEQIQQLVTGAGEKYILSAFRKFASGDPALADRMEGVITSVVSNGVYMHAVNHMLFQSYGDGTPHTAAQLLARIIALKPGSSSAVVPSVGHIVLPSGPTSLSGQGPSLPFDNGEISYKLIVRAIEAAAQLPKQLSAIMDADETKEYGSVVRSPKSQLNQCLIDCKGKTAQEVAIYLYTTYFYGPLNRFLRGDAEIRKSPQAILELIEITYRALMMAFADTPVKGLLPHFRMELKPSWMKGKEVGDKVQFPGFTSTHPDISGVNNMWDNIETNTFGATEDRLALLVFEGTKKLIRPQGKYFKKEIEDILPPGTTGQIVKKYETKWTDPKSKKVWVVDVYHLMILPQSQAPSQLEFHFNKKGSMHGAPGKSSGTFADLSGLQATSSSGDKSQAKGSGKAQDNYHIILGPGVDGVLGLSVLHFLQAHNFQTARRIIIVSGKNWTCYIRCVLMALNKIGSYDAVIKGIHALGGINLDSGVVVSSVMEAQIQAVIETNTGLNYYVSATDVQDGHTASSNVQHGTKVDLILTGAHFSLLE